MEKDIKKGNKDCPEDWVIAAFTMNELDPACSKEVTGHISCCGYCMDRAAVYYKAGLNEASSLKAPNAWMEKAVEILQDETPVKEKASILNRISAYVQDMIEPIAPLPGYALVTLAALLLIWFAVSDNAGVVTISSQRLAFRDKGAPSSFGFMGKEMVEPKDDMEITMKKGAAKFKWAGIDGAEEFTFSIMDKGNGEPVIADMKTKEPLVSIPADKLRKGELYSWRISGKTSDGSEFEYTGEFSLAR